MTRPIDGTKLERILADDLHGDWAAPERATDAEGRPLYMPTYRDALEWFLKLIREQPTVPQFGEWISVKDRLPTNEALVLVYLKSGQFEIEYLDNDQKWRSETFKDAVYWMTIPMLPEVDHKTTFCPNCGAKMDG